MQDQGTTPLSSSQVSRRGALAFGASALGVAGALGAAGGARAADASAASALDDLSAKAVSDSLTPSIAVGVMKNGSMIYAKAFGSANLETMTAATPKTIYKIGSNTKQFTATAILLLQEAGALSIDDPLSRFLPDFPRSSEVTLRQMLTHTSGLGNFTQTNPPEKIAQMSRVDYDPKALLAAMAATDPLFVAPPGTAWSYSNTAYVLLGIVVEKVSGTPWGQFLKTRIFDVQGLSDTAKDDVTEVLPRRASGYTDHPGSPTLFDNCSFESMSIPAGAGALRSTVFDLCAWHGALFGGKVLSPASLKAMTTPGRLKDGGQPFTIAAEGRPKEAVNYGFGLNVGTFESHPYFDHNGGISGFLSHLRTFHADKVTVALLVNTSGYGRKGLGEGLKAVEEAAYHYGLSA
jgi:CubicO group peptidase (beta-lactamase class C family)